MSVISYRAGAACSTRSRQLRRGICHARRLPVEAAWHHEARQTVGAVLQAR